MTELREGPDSALAARLDEFSQAASLSARYYTDEEVAVFHAQRDKACLLYTSPSPRDRQKSRMPSSA